QADGRTGAWEVPTGKELGTFAVPQTSKFSRLSPDAKLLIVAPCPHHNEMALYRFGEKEPQILSARNFSLSAVALSPDGRTIASGDADGWLHLWDAGSVPARLIAAIPPSAGDVTALAFSPDGKRLCAGRKDGLVTVWNVATRRPILQLKGHTTRIRYVAFAGDGGSLVSAAEDGGVRLWEIPPPPQAKTLIKDNSFGRVTFSNDGRWLAAGTSPGASLWDARTHMLVHRFDESYAVAFSPDSQVLATGRDDSYVRLWDISTRRLLRTLPARPE